ncbi:MAG: hypothetical protein ACR2RB_08860, partial [Gammaproteobacteria bacterium]
AMKSVGALVAIGVGVASALTPVWLGPLNSTVPAPSGDELTVSLPADAQEATTGDASDDEQNLIGHYRALAESAMDNRELDLAERLLENIERIDPRSVVLAEARELLEQRKWEVGEKEFEKREAEEARDAGEAERKEQEALRLAEEQLATELAARQDAERQQQEALRLAERRAAELAAQSDAERKQREARRIAEKQRAAELTAQREAERKRQEARRIAEEQRTAELAAQREAERKQQEARRIAEEQRAAAQAAQRQAERRRQEQEALRLAGQTRAVEQRQEQRVSAGETPQLAALVPTVPTPDPAEIANQTRLQMTDLDVVGGYLERFKSAIRGRNIVELANISRLSSDRGQLARQIFGQYAAIEVSISEVAWFERRELVSAKITIDRLITKEGDAVLPGPAWRTSRLIMRKKNGAWQKIEW